MCNHLHLHKKKRAVLTKYNKPQTTYNTECKCRQAAFVILCSGKENLRPYDMVFRFGQL